MCPEHVTIVHYCIVLKSFSREKFINLNELFFLFYVSASVIQTIDGYIQSRGLMKGV